MLYYWFKKMLFLISILILSSSSLGFVMYIVEVKDNLNGEKLIINLNYNIILLLVNSEMNNNEIGIFYELN